jgi:hypothetical protein
MPLLELLQLIAAAATATKDLVDVAKDVHANGGITLTAAQHATVKAIVASAPWQFNGSGPPP